MLGAAIPSPSSLPKEQQQQPYVFLTSTTAPSGGQILNHGAPTTGAVVHEGTFQSGVTQRGENGERRGGVAGGIGGGGRPQMILLSPRQGGGAAPILTLTTPDHFHGPTAAGHPQHAQFVRPSYLNLATVHSLGGASLSTSDLGCNQTYTLVRENGSISLLN